MSTGAEFKFEIQIFTTPTTTKRLHTKYVSHSLNFKQWYVVTINTTTPSGTEDTDLSYTI